MNLKKLNKVKDDKRSSTLKLLKLLNGDDQNKVKDDVTEPCLIQLSEDYPPEDIITDLDTWLSSDQLNELISDIDKNFDLLDEGDFNSLSEITELISSEDLLKEINKILSNDVKKEFINDFIRLRS